MYLLVGKQLIVLKY